jgi:hypothetical protein
LYEDGFLWCLRGTSRNQQNLDRGSREEQEELVNI